MKKTILFFLSGLFLMASLQTQGQLNVNYQTPPADLAAVVEAPATPGTSLNVEAGKMLLLDRPGYPDIADLAQEMLRLGGLRIDPATNGGSRPSYYTGITVMHIETGEKTLVESLPEPVKLSGISWSPNHDGFVFTHIRPDRLDLWYVALADLKPVQLVSGLNGLLGSTYSWLPDGSGLLVKRVPADRGVRPMPNPVPAGPVVSENLGKEAPNRTYQDLLGNKHDEALFKYLVTAEVVQTDLSGRVTPVADPGLYTGMDFSPDGNYLLVSRMKEPFSYLVPYYRFPYDLELWDKSGQLIRVIHSFPLMESIPKGFGATQPGPRNYSWRADQAASLYWVVALDEGDPANEVPYRDEVFCWAAPFEGQPVSLLKTQLRYGGISWFRADLAVVRESWQTTRQEITSFFNPADPAAGTQVIWDRSSEDRYGDPGNFISTENEWGQRVLMTDSKGRYLYLSGQGASEAGNRPFLDQFTIKDGTIKRLWRSEAPYYESLVRLIDPARGQLITSRQSVTEPSNYYMRDLKKDRIRQITFFENPYPFMEGVKKEMITYQREDGVQLSATLYTPAGWTPDQGPLPTLLWAYPREYKSKDAASQISGSPYTFTRMSPTSSIPFVTQGYAIIDGAAFPIVGEGDQEPNDTFIEQLVANGKAAIDHAASMGVTDPERVAVGGHSYGAFMTANLLAHCDYFAAGIARSGAYNRTLTPFGFQAEPRTFWEAPEVYFTMSPFMHADQVNEPILLIHGIADNNSGTFPMQSERFYNALKGHGATARLVMLPMESHGYAARESLLHMLWEQNRWLETYLRK